MHGSRERRRTKAATERDIEVLEDLDAACRNYVQIGCEPWVQPIDCGGTNGSDHSYRLQKLSRMQLATKRRRGGWSRGSWSYTITDAGRDLLTIKRMLNRTAANDPGTS